MGSENEPAKLLLPYLQRADELQKHEHLVAYYCRLYAMERGLKMKDRTKTTNDILVSLMKRLEKDKKSLKLGPDDSLYVEGFASNVFAKADKQDRAGRADLNTAKTFYAASIFFEILNQFGEIQPELEQKQKYAVWKAADIRKALKEGRKPVPGPPGGDEEFSDTSNLSSTAFDVGPSEHVSASHHGTGSSDVPSQFHETSNYQSSADTPALSRSLSIPPSSSSYQASIPPSSSSSYSAGIPPPPSYPTPDYPNDDFHATPSPTTRQENYFHSQPPNTHENSFHPQPQYHHQTYQPDPPQPPQPQNYSSHEFPPPPSSYPNFQSYPSFNDHTLPVAPTHAPYYQQGSEVSYPQQSAPPAPVSPAQTFEYDSNYMPPPEKIAEAHKAARFAVGALAFDDVVVAVDFLKKSLELLTNPSASH